MSRALIVTLLAVVVLASTAAVFVGGEEAALYRVGRHRQDLAAEELSPATRGYVAVFGCLRHDLAVAVTADGEVYALGSRADADEDHLFTPMSGRDDCEEGRAPRRIFALVEDAASLDNTIDRQYRARIVPPPVPGFVEGVIGYGAGSQRLAAPAARRLGVDLSITPLVAKGRHPGVLWVALVTLAVGLHGYALVLVVALWARRRRRRAAADAHFTDQENAFLNDTE